MMKFVRFGILLSILMFVFSCATQKDKKVEIVEQKLKLSFEEIDNNLSKLVAEAKKAGPGKVKFFSGDLFLKANAASMQGDYKTANLIYKHLVELIPTDDFVNKKHAITLIRTGDLKSSKDILAKIFNNSEASDSQTGLLLAGVHSSLGETKESKSIYKRILAKNPKNEEACVFLGKAYALEENTASAVKTLKGCEKKMKGRGIFSYYIGKLFVDKGDLKTALKYFEKSARIEPTFSQSIMGIGVVHEEEKRNDKAAKVYASYLDQHPNDGLILNRIVQLYFSTEQFAKVIPYAEKLSDLEPDNLNLKVKLGILYTDVKKYDQAIYTFKSLLRSVPTNDKILYYLGAIYQETAEYENSIDYFTLIPPESGLYQDSSVQVAQMLSSLAKSEAPQVKGGPNHKRFVQFIDKKISEGDLVVEFSIVKASYMESVQDFKESIASLEKVAEMETFSDNHKYYLASLYDKVADYKSSEQLIFKILKDDPQNAHAWNFLGYSLIERNEDMDKAFEYITNAVEISPNDGFIRDSLGWYYFKVGEIDKALDELLSAIKAEPTDVSIQKHLAIIYSEKRDFKTAKKHIVEAIRYSKEQTERQELNELFKNIESKRLPASFK